MFRRTALLAVVFAAASSAAAAEKPYGIALGAGLAAPKDIDSTPSYFSIGVRYRLGDNVALEPEIGYSRQRHRHLVRQPGLGSGYVRDISMSVQRLMVRPQIAKGVHLVLGVGAAPTAFGAKWPSRASPSSRRRSRLRPTASAASTSTSATTGSSSPTGATTRSAKWQEMYDLDVSGLRGLRRLPLPLLRTSWPPRSSTPSPTRRR